MLRRLAQGAVVLVALALLAFAWRCDGPWFDKHVFLPKQFFIPASRGIVFWSRALTAAIGALLLSFVPFLPRGASGRRLLLAVVLTIPAAEVVLRWRMGRLIRPELIAAMDALTTSDARYGVTFAPSMDRVQRYSRRYSGTVPPSHTHPRRSRLPPVESSSSRFNRPTGSSSRDSTSCGTTSTGRMRRWRKECAPSERSSARWLRSPTRAARPASS